MTDGAQPSIWIITDGRRGDVVQCEAIANRLSDNVRLIEVSPLNPWKFLMPWGPADPQELSKFKGALPHVIVAANRQAYPYAKRLYKQSKGRTRVLFMKQPGRDVSSFAHVWAPNHDQLSGNHVISTLTAPHLVSEEMLNACKQTPDPRLAALSGPKLAVILGGNSKHATYDDAAINAFTNKFAKAAGGNNPYFHMLAEADAILVSGDSHNMVGEALAAGVPVHVVEPTGNPKKFGWTLRNLREKNLIMAEDQPIKSGIQPRFDETPEITKAVKQAFRL